LTLPKARYAPKDQGIKRRRLKNLPSFARELPLLFLNKTLHLNQQK
jgi:hypothetical protein